MTGPQLPSPEHATTLDADLRALIAAATYHGWLQHNGAHETDMRKATDAVTAEFTRLRSRITALEMESTTLRALADALRANNAEMREQLSGPTPRTPSV